MESMTNAELLPVHAVPYKQEVAGSSPAPPTSSPLIPLQFPAFRAPVSGEQKLHICDVFESRPAPFCYLFVTPSAAGRNGGAE